MELTKTEQVREWTFEKFVKYIKGSWITIIDHLHIYPLKLPLKNIKTYYQLFCEKFLEEGDIKFKYNQLITCKVLK